MLLHVGQTRTEFCRDCERQTSQVLRHLQKNGTGHAIAHIWECIPGGHYVNMRPGPVPKELRDLEDAS
jgi:hypothetical protein